MMVLCISTISFAQKVTVGIKGGLNVATLSTKNIAWESKLGYHAGFQVHIHASRSLALQPEFVYSNQGAKYTGLLGQEHSLHVNYLNVPVLVQYMTGGGLRLETGPQIGFLTSVNDQVDGNTVSGYNKNTFKKTDVSWAFGLGYVTSAGIGFDARYNLGITDISNNTGLAKTTNNVGQIGLFFELR